MLEGLIPPKNNAIVCKIEKLAATFENSDKTIFMDAVDDPETWPANTLSRALRQRNVSVSDLTITKHRLRACACYRD